MHVTCADLLKEQERLDGVIDSLSMPLSFFDDFEDIGKKLGLPLVIETRAERRVVDTSRKANNNKALVAKAKANRKKPALLNSSKFLCSIYIGYGCGCDCGQHEGYGYDY